MNFDDMERGVYGNVEEDPELLAELMALQKEEEVKQRRSAKPPVRNAKPLPGNLGGLDPTLLAAALSDDIPGDVDGLEDDADLLNELGALVGGQEDRITSSESALSSETAQRNNQMISRLSLLSSVYNNMIGQAKASGASAKIRRYERALDKLSELTKKAESGQKIDEEEIPVAPPGFQVAAPGTESASTSRNAPPVPPRQAPAPPLPPRTSSGESVKREQIRSLLQRRHDAYVANGKLAVQARDKGAAVQYVNAAKQFQQALSVLNTVPLEDLDINEVPPSPVPFSLKDAPATTKHESPLPNVPMAKPQDDSKFPLGPPAVAPKMEKKEIIIEILQRRKQANVQNGKAAMETGDKKAAVEYMNAAKQFQEALKALDSVSIDDLAIEDIPPSPKLYRKVEEPKTFLDGLLSRKARFEQYAKNYKEKGEDRKHRMNSRMASQYDEAIKEYREGRQIDVNELPTLPDMLPLPPQTKSQSTDKTTAIVQAVENLPAGPSKSIRQPEVGPYAHSGDVGQSRNQTQLNFLIQRQQEFKQAAIHAKSKGNMDLAKKYLLEAKGFEPMIKAAQAGLPVSIKNTPIPPQELSSQSSLQPKIVPVGDRPSDTGVEGRGEVLSLIERTLIEQIQMSETNRMRFTRLGDVGKVKLFEEWAKVSKKDLLFVREVAKQGLRLPQFHYENRPIPNADLFPELAEDVLELSIFNATNVPLPSGYESSHANIFVKYDLPYPSESHQCGKTKLVSGTNSPEFSETMILQIGARKTRGQKLTRVLKRAPLKLEVFQKGSFLRSDKLLGVCEVKMDSLESAAQIEECAPLKDGRKAVGGLLRVRVRIREPLGDAKVAVKNEKWLILDN